MHELRFHDQSSFLTLTYDDEHMPRDGSLVVSDFQGFMKRLRERISVPIRYYHCGEYGDDLDRPHYHAILFGFDFRSDLYRSRRTRTGHQIWSSHLLDSVWGKGFARVGSVSFDSCAYVARYICKKVNGRQKASHYERVNFGQIPGRAYGECFSVRPEYSTMSKGIGRRYWEQFRNEIVKHDSIVTRGHEVKPPRTYDRWLAAADESLYEEMKAARECASLAAGSRSAHQLAIDEINKQAQIRSLSRSLEIG